MFTEIWNWLTSLMFDFGYTGIFFLMFIESSFLPFPSEIVMIPAGFLAAQGKMDAGLAIVAATLGSIAGALLNYGLAVYMGKPLLEKYGRYFFLPPERLHKVNSFFKNHGEVSTFIGRLLPVIRQYISFPAGLARMNLIRFCLFTGLGAGIWVTILTAIGYTVGKNETLVAAYLKESTLAVVILCTGIIGIYYIIHKRRKKKLATVSELSL